MDLDTKVLVAALGALGTVAAAVLPRLLEWAREKRLRRAEVKAVSRIRRLYERREQVMAEVRSLVRDTRASRVLILRSENGGGIPQAGTPIHVSVVFEDRDGHLPSVRSDYQSRDVDGWYESLLAKVVGQGHVSLLTTDIDPSAELRDLYESDGITRSEIFRIGVSSGKAVLYMSMNFRDSDQGLWSSEKVAISNALAVFRKIFQDDDLMMTPSITWRSDRS